MHTHSHTRRKRKFYFDEDRQCIESLGGKGKGGDHGSATTVVENVLNEIVRTFDTSMTSSVIITPIRDL